MSLKPTKTDAMNVVVENDAEQDAAGSVVQHANASPQRRVYKRRQTPARKGTIISAPREKPKNPVSFRLTDDELRALRANAKMLEKRSLSNAIRLAIQQYVAQNGLVQVPASIGVVDRIYGATVHHDVVKLANLLRGLEFVLRHTLDELQPSTRTDKLKLMLADAEKTLEQIAGQVTRKAA